jgi:transposase-like protein
MASTTTADASTAAPSPAPAPTLLKTDVPGRVRVTPERRAAILAEFDRSGVSAAQFARLAGINYSTFAQWVQRHRRPRAARKPGRHWLRRVAGGCRVRGWTTPSSAS